MFEVGDCVKIIYGLDKGKLGRVVDTRCGYAQVRVVFDEHEPMYYPEWYLEYC